MLSALPSLQNTPALPAAADSTGRAQSEAGTGFAELMQRQTELHLADQQNDRRQADLQARQQQTGQQLNAQRLADQRAQEARSASAAAASPDRPAAVPQPGAATGNPGETGADKAASPPDDAGPTRGTASADAQDLDTAHTATTDPAGTSAGTSADPRDNRQTQDSTSERRDPATAQARGRRAAGSASDTLAASARPAADPATEPALRDTNTAAATTTAAADTSSPALPATPAAPDPGQVQPWLQAQALIGGWQPPPAMATAEAGRLAPQRATTGLGNEALRPGTAGGDAATTPPGLAALASASPHPVPGSRRGPVGRGDAAADTPAGGASTDTPALPTTAPTITTPAATAQPGTAQPGDTSTAATPALGPRAGVPAASPATADALPRPATRAATTALRAPGASPRPDRPAQAAAASGTGALADPDGNTPAKASATDTPADPADPRAAQQPAGAVPLPPLGAAQAAQAVQSSQAGSTTPATGANKAVPTPDAEAGETEGLGRRGGPGRSGNPAATADLLARPAATERGAGGSPTRPGDAPTDDGRSAGGDAPARAGGTAPTAAGNAAPLVALAAAGLGRHDGQAEAGANGARPGADNPVAGLAGMAQATATPLPTSQTQVGGPGLPSAAGATTAEARIPVPLDSPAFAPALGAQISLFARDGVQTARLELNPAEMGPISVQIAVEGGAARVDFQADRATTRDVIEASLPALAGALQDAGLTLSGGGVFQHQPGRQQQPEPGSPAPNRPADGRNVGAGSDAAALAAVPLRSRSRGLVDLVA